MTSRIKYVVSETNNHLISQFPKSRKDFFYFSWNREASYLKIHCITVEHSFKMHLKNTHSFIGTFWTQHVNTIDVVKNTKNWDVYIVTERQNFSSIKKSKLSFSSYIMAHECLTLISWLMNRCYTLMGGWIGLTLN